MLSGRNHTYSGKKPYHTPSLERRRAPGGDEDDRLARSCGAGKRARPDRAGARRKEGLHSRRDPEVIDAGGVGEKAATRGVTPGARPSNRWGTDAIIVSRRSFGVVFDVKVAFGGGSLGRSIEPLTSKTTPKVLFWKLAMSKIASAAQADRQPTAASLSHGGAGAAVRRSRLRR
jgi:hypothetical protein